MIIADYFSASPWWRTGGVAGLALMPLEPIPHMPLIHSPFAVSFSFLVENNTSTSNGLVKTFSLLGVLLSLLIVPMSSHAEGGPGDQCPGLGAPRNLVVPKIDASRPHTYAVTWDAASREYADECGMVGEYRLRESKNGGAWTTVYTVRENNYANMAKTLSNKSVGTYRYMVEHCHPDKEGYCEVVSANPILVFDLNVRNQSVNEDGSKTVSFDVFDIDDTNGSITLSAISSNTTLLPNRNITFGGFGVSRTVTLKPAKNKSGSTTVTITVSDEEKSAQDSFILTVNAVNDAPKIGNITNQSVNEDGSKSVSFNVSDIDDANGSLRLSASSSNTTLLPSGDITFGGSGRSRTVTLQPTKNKSGNSTVTIRVSDGRKTSQDRFTLTVRAVNDAPAISSISNQTMNEDGSKSISFNVSDVDNANGSLTLSASSSDAGILPVNRVVFSGSGGSRGVTLKPDTNKNGNVSVTITVSDGSKNASDSFQLMVNPINDLPVIGALPDKTIKNNTTTEVQVSISDAETALELLQVSATSDNASLLPNSGVRFGSVAGGKGILLTPVSEQTGSSTVTVSVNDGSGSVSKSFIVMVEDPGSLMTYRYDEFGHLVEVSVTDDNSAE